MNGILIVFEGISGSGKSESIQQLRRYLSAHGIDTTMIEWNSNPHIRHIVNKLNRWGLLTSIVYSLLQWIGFYLDYFNKILPELKKNRIVIADRYVYTALTRDVVNGSGKFLGWVLYRFAREPDLIFFCNTPPQVCYQRIQARGKALFHTNRKIKRNQRLENKDLFYLEQMKQAYMRLFTHSKYCKTWMIEFVHDNHSQIHYRVKQYIDRKMGGTVYKSICTEHSIGENRRELC